MLLAEVARTSEEVAATASRLQKIDRLASCLRELSPAEAPIGVAYLSGRLPQGTIGVGWATVRGLPEPSDAPPTIELLEVDATATEIAAAVGPGSQARRRAALERLYARATEGEQRFLTGLLLGGLRQGALEGVMVEAVARAGEVPARAVRRALMLTGDLGVVASAAAADGEDGLGRFGLQLLRPIQPMLAQSADDVASALDRAGPAAVEWKLDGARLQVHRLGSEVRAYTRNLADVTARVPEIVDVVLGLPVDSIVLDGEAIALEPDERPRPFQETMSRFGSSTDVAQQRRRVPLASLFFDVLHLDGEDLLDRPGSERWAALACVVDAELRVPRVETADAGAAEQFLDDAIARGHEGVVVKALESPYEAGRRGAGWIKVKRAHTFDLVVLAAEWGHGRRQGWLSNLHLGARDPATGGFVMLGKTFKGMTDELLAWQTERFLELETRSDGHTVHVRPELVVEIAFDGVQRSRRYPGGVALRFARVKGYRPDKRPDEADTITAVQALAEPAAAE